MRVRRLRPSRRGVAHRATARRGLRGASTERSLLYRASNDRWWLCYPCSTCGGAQLPLLARPPIDDIGRAQPLLDRCFDTDGCPGCQTRRNRSYMNMSRPRVWYDTVVRDWVVQLPWGGPGDAAIFPLEIRWFDAPLADVYRAAGDLAFSGDAFEEPPGD